MVRKTARRQSATTVSCSATGASTQHQSAGWSDDLPAHTPRMYAKGAAKVYGLARKWARARRHVRPIAPVASTPPISASVDPHPLTSFTPSDGLSLRRSGPSCCQVRGAVRERDRECELPYARTAPASSVQHARADVSPVRPRGSIQGRRPPLSRLVVRLRLAPVTGLAMPPTITPATALNTHATAPSRGASPAVAVSVAA